MFGSTGSSMLLRITLAVTVAVLLVLAAPRTSTGQQSGASLKISPSAGTFEVGSLVDISFVIDTGGDAVNAVNADILFPADKLQVVNPAASTSFITIWVTAPSYSNTDGTINFQGGLPNPGIKTSAAVVSTVTFRVKSPGRAVLRYAASSQVLRNDGQGTNILTSTGSADLILKNPPPAGPVVTSPSHPDSNIWYNNPKIQLTWTPVDNATSYSYILDQNPKTVPDEEGESSGTSVEVEASGDSVWYFHIRAKTEIWGGTSTYSVRIDRTAPAAFTPELDSNTVAVEEPAIIRFLTTDAASGIDHYEIKQISLAGDDRQETLFVEATSPYTIQPLPEGEYQFIVRAIDRAGNVTEGDVELRVVAAGLPFFARVPLFQNPAVANAVLISLALLVLILIIWILLRRLRLRTAFRNDLAALERDARKKAAALQQELQEIREAEQLIHQNIGPEAFPGSSPPAQPPMPPANPPVQ